MKSDDETFVQRYAGLPDEDLVHLSERRSDLEPLAQLALDRELTNRRLRIQELKRQRVEDEVSDQAAWESQRETEIKRAVGESRRFKWYLIVASVALIIGIAVEPKESRKELLSTLATAMTVLGLAWILALVQRFVTARKKKACRDA